MNTKIAYLFLLVGSVACTVLKAQEKQAEPFIKVEGEVTKPLKLELAPLTKMQSVTVNLKDRDGKEHPYVGVPVVKILEMAGVTTGKQLRGENLTKYVMVKCADGYEVLFSLAELDTSITNKIPILAYMADGNMLPAGKGPFRLVMPDEGKPARSCFQVTEFIVRFAKE
jgi:DMSO/TMAO reductase YedYZ molybdopterin-dependent catalytic subunit